MPSVTINNTQYPINTLAEKQEIIIAYEALLTEYSTTITAFSTVLASIPDEVLSTANKYGNTLLHSAVWACNANLVAALLERPAAITLLGDNAGDFFFSKIGDGYEVNKDEPGADYQNTLEHMINHTYDNGITADEILGTALVGFANAGMPAAELDLIQAAYPNIALSDSWQDLIADAQNSDTDTDTDTDSDADEDTDMTVLDYDTDTEMTELGAGLDALEDLAGQ